MGKTTMVNQFHFLLAVALCLTIGLGPVVAHAHSHDGHQEEDCSVTVFQHSSVAVTTDIIKIKVAAATAPNIIQTKHAVISSIRACQHARAPPYHL
jgi:hypothetical protein